MSAVRGRPPRLAGGMSGSNRRNWSSLSAWPEPKSPTSARSAGVHMARSKQEITCNAAQQAGSARQTALLTPLQTGTQEIDPVGRRAALMGLGESLAAGRLEGAEHRAGNTAAAV